MRWVAVFLLVLLASCAAPTAKVAPRIPLSAPLDRATEPAQPVLNVSILVLDYQPERKARRQTLRSAEAVYLPVLLRDTLNLSGHWGAVRVVPEPDPTAELMVRGRIVASDGVELKLDIEVVDAAGYKWLAKSYVDYSLDHKYRFPPENPVEPFEDLYHQIANDMLQARRSRTDAELSRIVDTAFLRYAATLSPEAFARYLTEDDADVVTLSALPAENDPLLERVRKIRDSEYQFIDIVDEQYEILYGKMLQSYAYWRRYSYELTEYNDQIEARGATSKAPRGSWPAIESIYHTYQESKLNEDELREMAFSFDAEMSPTVTEVEGSMVELSGTLRDQYSEWRALLRRYFATERNL